MTNSLKSDLYRPIITLVAVLLATHYTTSYAQEWTTDGRYVTIGIRNTEYELFYSPFENNFYFRHLDWPIDGPDWNLVDIQTLIGEGVVDRGLIAEAQSLTMM